MKITFEEATKLKFKKGEIYSVTFYDGCIDSKYSINTMRTDYMSFIPVYGGVYFTTFKEANKLASELNLATSEENNSI